MKRWILVFLLVLVSVLGALVPAAARAGTSDGNGLASGKAVKVAISTEGQERTYSFAAKANKNVTFQVTAFHLTNDGSGGGVYLNFYEPGSTSTYTDCYFTANSFCNFSPPESGTWSVQADPWSDSVGSFVLTFANNVATKALASGKAGTTTLKYQGQEAGYTFIGKSNRNVTFQVTGFHFTNNGSGGGVYLNFYEPGSTSTYTNCYLTANSFCNFSPPESGKWAVLLVPWSASVGHLTLTFANDVANVKLAAGKAVTTKLKYEGQEAAYTFGAKANKSVTFQISKFHFTNNGSGGGVYLNFYEPGSTSTYTNCYLTANGSCSFTAPVRGTYSALLVPWSASVGSLRLKMG